MKVIAVNGSPRKKWNTATLLEKVLEGAASQGAETKLTHLYDLRFKGCTSCFACKTKGGKSYGTCAVRDDLTPLYAEIKEADALVEKISEKDPDQEACTVSIDLAISGTWTELTS